MLEFQTSDFFGARDFRIKRPTTAQGSLFAQESQDARTELIKGLLEKQTKKRQNRTSFLGRLMKMPERQSIFRALEDKKRLLNPFNCGNRTNLKWPHETNRSLPSASSFCISQRGAFERQLDRSAPLPSNANQPYD